VALQKTVEQTVSGLGLELVEIERSAGGLLRITIDHPWQPDQPERFVTVEDCESVTRQLQFALEVESVEYRRLEVSSPGIDRPLRTEKDFARFTGSVIDITLKAPVGRGLPRVRRVWRPIERSSVARWSKSDLPGRLCGLTNRSSSRGSV
jgi:ribosome maturation factor RimP